MVINFRQGTIPQGTRLTPPPRDTGRRAAFRAEALKQIADGIRQAGKNIRSSLEKRKELDFKISQESNRVNNILSQINTPKNVFETGRIADIGGQTPQGIPQVRIRPARPEERQQAFEIFKKNQIQAARIKGLATAETKKVEREEDVSGLSELLKILAQPETGPDGRGEAIIPGRFLEPLIKTLSSENTGVRQAGFKSLSNFFDISEEKLKNRLDRLEADDEQERFREKLQFRKDLELKVFKKREKFKDTQKREFEEFKNKMKRKNNLTPDFSDVLSLATRFKTSSVSAFGLDLIGDESHISSALGFINTFRLAQGNEELKIDEEILDNVNLQPRSNLNQIPGDNEDSRDTKPSIIDQAIESAEEELSDEGL